MLRDKRLRGAGHPVLLFGGGAVILERSLEVVAFDTHPWFATAQLLYDWLQGMLQDGWRRLLPRSDGERAVWIDRSYEANKGSRIRTHMTRLPAHDTSPMTACATSPSDPPFEASLVDLHGLDAPFAAKSATDPDAHEVFQQPQVQNAAVATAHASSCHVHLSTGDLSASDCAIALHGLPSKSLSNHEQAMVCVHSDDRASIKKALTRAAVRRQASDERIRRTLRTVESVVRPDVLTDVRWRARSVSCGRFWATRSRLRTTGRPGSPWQSRFGPTRCERISACKTERR